MSLISFLRPLLAQTDYTDPGQGQLLVLRDWARGRAGDSCHWASWQAGWAQLPHHLVPSQCQAAPPSHAPTSWPPPTPSPQAGEGSDV